MRERWGISVSGWFLMASILGGLGYFIYTLLPDLQSGARIEDLLDPYKYYAVGFGLIFLFFVIPGFFVVEPNEAKVLMFLGSYIGTVKRSGWRWTIPFLSHTIVSTKVRNFETNQIRINDAQGNPVDAAAIVIWKVADTAQALFQVSDCQSFVQTQSEAALRSLVMQYPYEPNKIKTVSLTTHTQEIAQELKKEMETRTATAGIAIIETRLSHLSYAPEIAGIMLQRQQTQSEAIARQTMAIAAVDVVEQMIQQIEIKDFIRLSEPDKTRLASDLLVALCNGKNQSK
jgi:regulator of protease activity HflC (stomatin/prohibitin superfamily)